MADPSETPRDTLVTFLPHRLNRQPVVVRGLTADELWICAGLSAAAGFALGLPLAAPTLRSLIYGGFEVFGIGFRQPALLKQLEKVARLHLRQQVADPVLRAKLTPDYTLGCKRVLLSNNYYPALAQPNVEVHATGVTALRGNVVIGQDGSEREVDTVIFGTGFAPFRGGPLYYLAHRELQPAVADPAPEQDAETKATSSQQEPEQETETRV